MDFSEKETTGRWEARGHCRHYILGDMAKAGYFPMKPFGAFTHHRCPEKCSHRYFLPLIVIFLDYRMKV
jgi:hypothetical protein